MGGQAHLLKLVDLALSNTEVGAVNFNHLRTLLLAIINGSTDGKKNVVEQAIVENEQEAGNNEIGGGDSGININEKHDQNKDLSKKLQSVLSTQEKLEERINSLENDLNAYAKFASNDQILRNTSIDEEDDGSVKSGSSAGGKRASSADILAPTWQNMKNKKRLESVEEAIEKLFSLINELLGQQQKDQGGDEMLKNLRKDLTDLATTSDAEQKKLYDLHHNLDQKHAEMLEDLKRLAEDIKNMKSSIEQNRDDVNINKNGIETNSKAIEDLKKKSNSLKKRMEESMAKINTTEDNETKKKENVEESDSNKNNSQMVQDQLDDINKRIEDITEKLNKKSDVSTVDELSETLSSLDKKVDESVSSIKEELDKLKESMSNLDNAEVKSLLDSMDDLKKMAGQIEDLRKLNDLKDLADNVDSLKDLKSELDRLNQAFKEKQEKDESEFSKMFEDFLKKQKELEEGLNEMKNEMANESVDGKKSLDGDVENKMNGLSDELKNLKNSYENLMKMLSDLQNSQTFSAENDNTTASTGLDPSLIAAIQHLAQQNRQQIAALQADLNILKKLQVPSTTTLQQQGESDNNNNNNNDTDPSLLDNLHNHLVTLQEEQVKVAGQFSNMLDDSKDEFMRKQQHIDALYDYIDKLQNNKADKEDISSSMNVKADKQALDSKVNISTFDERYQMLEQALQDALNRLDQFVEKETSLTNSLNKLHTDLDSKMDSDAEKKLKKFMDDRLKEIQKSRNNLQPVEHDHDVILEMRNAAGLRRPMPLSYHCISCDRPVDITLRGVMGTVPQNFPAKKSIGPYTSYELDQLRNNHPKKIQQPLIERMNGGGRQCGGYHTTVNRTQKNHQYSNDFADTYEKNLEHEDLSIIDCVMGKDGQIYRGRFKPSQYIQPIPKRAVPPNLRSKHHLHKHRYHSATTPAANKDLELQPLKDEGRASSANLPVKERDDNSSVSDHVQPTPPSVKNGSPVTQTASRDKQRSSRNNSPVPYPSSKEKQRTTNTSPISLPPISRDGSLVGDELSNGNA